MKILHVLNGAIGGASVGAYELMRTSRAAGAHEHFVVYPGLPASPSPEVAALCTEARVFPMRWWNRKPQLSWGKAAAVFARELQLTRLGLGTHLRLTRFVQERGIELVHTNTAATIDGAIVAARLGLPHVWHVRERIGADGFMKFPLPDPLLARTIAGLSAVVVPMSRYCGELFFRNGVGAKTEVVYDGVDPSLFWGDAVRARGLALRRAWGVPDDAVLVGKVAAVTSEVKRHDLFLRAAGRVLARHPQAFFAIVGPLPTSRGWARNDGVRYYEGLQALAQREGLQGRLVFPGNVTDVGAMMQALDVLAHACDLEGFGRVAIEAMAAGKPVVGPDRGGFAESVVHGETGTWVRAGDDAALADGIAALVGDGALRERYGAAGRARAQARFSPEAHLAAMTAIYERARAAGPITPGSWNRDA